MDEMQDTTNSEVWNRIKTKFKWTDIWTRKMYITINKNGYIEMQKVIEHDN